MRQLDRGWRRVAARDRLERLSPQDVSNLRVEDRGLPMNVAALVILGQPAGAGPPGQPSLDAVRGLIERRLHLAPRLRQVLYPPRPGLGPPVWTDDPCFDVRRHVRARAVPAPGDEPALLTVCSELTEGRLDRSRPLWEIWLVTGLADGRTAMLIRLHHVVADGIAALAMIGALFDPDPGAPVPDAPGWAPRPVPAASELFADNVRGRVLDSTDALARLRRPAALTARLRLLAGQARQLRRDGRAPGVSLNVPVTAGRRRLLLVRADVERARAVAHAHGGTVNDVLLAAVAGGLRSLLEARGELRPGLVLKASVAVSLRGQPDQQAAGNRTGMMIVPLPVAEPDAGRCLTLIARATAERKRQLPYQPGGRLAQHWMVRVMSRQRLVNLLVSNLPGPAAPLSFAGVPVQEIFQIGVVQGNLPVSAGALSYAGQLGVSVVGDPGAAPDLAVLADGMSGALEQLGAAVTAGPGRTAPAGQ